jgi:glycerate 2-kinase
MRHHLRAAFQAGIRAVEPQQAVGQHVQRCGELLAITDGVNSDRWPMVDLRLLAIGKAAGPMATAIAELVGVQRIDRALVISPEPVPNLPAHWLQIWAGHPLPTAASLAAGQAVRQLVANGTTETVVLVCISGGATALVSDPLPGISLSTLRAIYQTLLASGAEIQEMNVVRSGLDRLKAGGLVALAQPAQVVGLVLSDVVGDSIATIGSGLTLTAHNVLVGNNAQACQGAAAYLTAQGYRVITNTMQGEAKIVGAEIARAIQQAPPGTALIYGGETTVTMPPANSGCGGRNQELVLAAALELNESSGLVGAVGTDGIDGCSPAAGAMADRSTLPRAIELGLVATDYLQRHDSYHFFTALGDSIITGPTGTNVADLAIAIHPLKK